MKIAVIGAGSWGTALAQHLALKNHEVVIWARNPQVIETINSKHYNPRYLNDITLSESITATASYEECLDQAQAVVVVTPSNLLRQFAQALAPFMDTELPIIICSKGIEEETGLLPIEVFEAEVGNADRLAVLSGPNHAEEVSKQIPSATVIASSNKNLALFFQEVFVSDSFRTYISNDPTGVELCGAFKNVIAIAVGLSYGYGFGDNTAALLITRGIAEMSRLVHACGGQPLTCMGLAGCGDMVATCTSQHSRNRRFGELLAKKGTLDDFTTDTHMIVEGALACRTLQTLAKKYQVDIPITQMVYGVIWEGTDVEQAAKDLTERPLTTEFYGL